jgi:glycosyltransferase involved in cell wall biosynthesis
MRILSVGRLVPKKGHPYLIRSCAQLKRKGYAVECEIYGTGPLLAELLALVAELDLEDRVSLKGSRTQDELAGIYRQADVFALVPFIQENGDRDGLPNVLLEAMASGLPVIASAVSGIPELVIDEETGLLVNPQDEDGLTLALERMLRDHALRARLARAGRDWVEHSFSAERNVEQLAALLGFAARDKALVAEPIPLAITMPDLDSEAGFRQ